MKIAQVILKPEKEKPVKKLHPWIFSGAIERIEGYEFPGQVCHIFSNSGEFLGTGFVNKKSGIVCRLFTKDRVNRVEHIIRERLINAIKRRERLKSITNCIRYVHGEGDGLPGLIIDGYDDVVVFQIISAALENYRELIVETIIEEMKPSSIYERSDSSYRGEEGLNIRKGHVFGKEVEEVVIREHHARFTINITKGHKTGFYIDQRDNRKILGDYARDKDVCDCFCYTGGFSVYAGLNNAKSLTLVDSSKPALELAEKNLRMNGITEFKTIRANAFDFLRKTKDDFDIVILDPPSFVKKIKYLHRAIKGYKDINIYGIKRVRKGGYLFTFACSHHMTIDLFQQVIFYAASDVGRPARIIRRFHQPEDHPFSIYHPEGEYLKGLLLQID